MDPFEVELAAFQESGGQKIFNAKKEKNYLPDLSHGPRKCFSANESYHFLSYIKGLKPVAVKYAFLYQIL